jgi:NAD(P)-dependent dehydrogenase (short-subunit alcohol dehydrogenase family)
MTTLVTGAAGFIGSTLVDRRLAAGDRVVGYDNFSTGQRRFLDGALASPNFTVIEGDLIDPARLAQAMAGATRVFHLAANADVRFGTKHPRPISNRTRSAPSICWRRCGRPVRGASSLRRPDRSMPRRRRSRPRRTRRFRFRPRSTVPASWPASVDLGLLTPFGYPDGASPFWAEAFNAAASLLIADGHSAKWIQKFMGHSSIAVTFDTYGHLFPSEKDDQEAVSGMERRVTGEG